MIVTHGKTDHPRRLGQRPGIALTVLFLLALPVLVVVLLLAVNTAFLAEARVTLQNNADADALAAAQCLVDDAWLTGIPSEQLRLVGVARSEAQLYASKNKVLGQPLSLELPPTPGDNPPDGDVVFAFLDQPGSRTLAVADLGGTYNGSPFLPFINTVRVHARRLKARGTAIGLWGGNFSGFGSADLVTRATATLDRDVVGFKPMGDQNVPLVPIALLTRSALPGKGLPTSWENELQLGHDNWMIGSGASFSSGSDGMGEATMVFSVDARQASAALLLIGIADLSSPSQQNLFTGQVAFGLSAGNLQGLGGTFALAGIDNRLTVPAVTGDMSFFAALASQLNQIQGQKRVWPLFETLDSSNGRAVITGFVAARVVLASATASGMNLVLQPCLLSTRTALTNAAQRGVGGVSITNPYICRLRLVE